MIATEESKLAVGVNGEGYSVGVYKSIIFDDYEKDDVYGSWSQVCQHCTDKHKFDNSMIDEGVGHGICGVQGCENEADHYIDFG